MPNCEEWLDSLGSRRALLQRAMRRELQKCHLPVRLEGAVLSQLSGGQADDVGRPMLLGLIVLYAFEAAGGRPIEAALPFAVSVELLASAASVLDDLQDGDDVGEVSGSRRGGGAELVALLLTMSHRTALNSCTAESAVQAALFQRFVQHEFDALVGQHLANEADETHSISESLLDSERKSGPFGRLAGELGALLAGATPDALDELGQFGWHLLVIDQLQNDVAGIWPGGSRGTDLAENRMTVPISFTRRLAHHARESNSLTHSEPGPTAAQQRKKFAEHSSEAAQRVEVYQSGAVHYSWIVAARHRFSASKIVDRFEERNPDSLLRQLIQPT